MPRRLGDDLAPRVDDVRAAPVREPSLVADAIHEHDEALEHLRVEAGELSPVRLRLSHGGRATGGHQQNLRAVVYGERRQERLPRVVADEHGHASERGVERTHRLAALEKAVLLERRIAGEVQLAVDVLRAPVLDVDRTVVAAVGVALVEADQRSRTVGECGGGLG